jgi:tRNA nucleotidyltransferase (CCA-adding enzyme)
VIVPCPPGLSSLLARLREAGGHSYVVGGAVRDALLGLPVSDYDVEVFGLAPDVLRRTLEAAATVNAVGEAFTVFKVSGLPGLGAVDVSLPRRDSKTGPGHRGIAVAGDPSLGAFEAARRRDFTINALSYDPLTDEILDPHGGRRDLEAGVLRAVDPNTFGDDPRRASSSLSNPRPRACALPSLSTSCPRSASSGRWRSYCSRRDALRSGSPSSRTGACCRSWRPS